MNNQNEKIILKSTISECQELSNVCCKRSKTDNRIKFINLKNLELSHSLYRMTIEVYFIKLTETRMLKGSKAELSNKSNK